MRGECEVIVAPSRSAWALIRRTSAASSISTAEDARNLAVSGARAATASPRSANCSPARTTPPLENFTLGDTLEPRAVEALVRGCSARARNST